MSNPDLSHESCEKHPEIERVARLMDKAHRELQYVLEPMLRELESAGVKLGVEFIQYPIGDAGARDKPCYEIKFDHPNYRVRSFIHPT